MTVNNRGIYASEPVVKWSQIIAWALSLIAVPAVSVFMTMQVQGAVYGQRIASLENHSNDSEMRLRSIEAKLERVITLIEAKGAR